MLISYVQGQWCWVFTLCESGAEMSLDESILFGFPPIFQLTLMQDSSKKQGCFCFISKQTDINSEETQKGLIEHRHLLQKFHQEVSLIREESYERRIWSSKERQALHSNLFICFMCKECFLQHSPERCCRLPVSLMLSVPVVLSILSTLQDLPLMAIWSKSQTIKWIKSLHARSGHEKIACTAERLRLSNE